MAVSFVAEAHAGESSGTNLAISRPTGTATGDMLVALLMLFDAGGVISTVAPAGWTVHRAVNNTAAGDNHAIALLSRLDDGSASYTITWDGSSQFRDGAIFAYTGVDSVDVTSMTARTTASTIFRGTGVTTTVANDMVVMLGGHANVGGSLVSTPPAGMTERLDLSTLRLYAADVLQAAAAATGDKDATLGAADANTAGLITLKPIVAAAADNKERMMV